MVAVCLGAAVLVALSVLRPGPEPGQQALVVCRPVSAGSVLTQADLQRRSIPLDALPESGLAGDEAVGSRAAISLEPGTVLTASMTSAAIAQGLTPDERLVQVPVEVGAELAVPGARVDLIGEAAPTIPQDQGTGTGAESGAEPKAESGAEPASAAPPALGAPRTAVLARGARVVLVQAHSDGNQWTSGRKVTFVTLAVAASDATLVVGAATNGALGVVLSP
ncbi:SAF domain-containing protein [Actinomyces slackii]|uniref:SAF domain-containing protein n=1 Tax=Actinomyces slackii TaxID=52774 RepID=UPI0004791E66|nr:SAF domain-containing protein [Actinomyces slackii]